jgi:pSer/pThr/pTyr-binding forkhead associated (FHA) protein
MRVEILVDGSDEPQIYPINKPKMMLGSGETCDIVISSGNISRKHLMIVNEGDSFFVVDQGSTNGSFINEERLVPGRRTEFTSFFPVRLGDNVLITLLSDEEANAEKSDPMIPLYPKEEATPPTRQLRGADESTKMISLADLKKAKTSDLQVKREKAVKKVVSKAKAAPPKKTKRAKENQRFQTMLLLTVIAVGAIGYYNYTHIEEEKPVARMGEVVTGKPIKKPEPVKPVEVEAPKIPESELLTKERYLELLGDLKCLTDIEKYFCEKIPGAQGKYGAVQIGSTMHILVEATPFIAEARTWITHPTPDAEGKYPTEIYEPYRQVVWRTALALFFLNGFPNDIDWEKIKDLKLSIGVFEVWEGTTYLQIIGGIYPQRLQEFKRQVQKMNIQNVQKIGAPALEFTNDFYTVRF